MSMIQSRDINWGFSSRFVPISLTKQRAMGDYLPNLGCIYAVGQVLPSVFHAISLSGLQSGDLFSSPILKKQSVYLSTH